MENFKNILNKIFLYNEPKNHYEFSLPEEPLQENTIENSNKETKFSTDINLNLQNFKVKYNLLINSDIVIREFNISIKSKKYRAFLIFIDGMVDSELINNFVLRPLMNNLNSITNTINFSNYKKNYITKKFDLENYIFNSLVPQNNIKKAYTFEEIILKINTGECALLVDTLNVRI